MRHGPQLRDHFVQARQHHRIAALAQHQRIGQVVDVLAGAGEVHELQRRRQRGVALQPLLDVVLYRLDVVVGRALDLLDPRGIGRRKAFRKRAQSRGIRGGERRQLRDRRLGRKRQQPFDLHVHARVDQPVFGEHPPQRIGLGGVAAVERGQGEQLGVGHGGSWRGGNA